MITLKKNETPPTDARITHISPDGTVCYFDGDPEVIAMNDAKREALLRRVRYEQKADRLAALNNLIVTAENNQYNADETSQQRMARAILVMDDVETITWTMADNTRAEVTRAELREALKLAVQKQTELWPLDVV